MSLKAVSRIGRKILTLQDIPDEKMFGDQDFQEAPELYAICVELINAHEAQFSHLVNAGMEVLWKKEGGKSKGRAVLGRTQMASALVGFYSDKSVIITIAADHCANAFFTDQMFQALLYHEMCHISWDPKDGKLGLVGHDFEGFVSELAAFGAWDLTFKKMVGQAQQLPLFKDKKETDDARRS